MKSVPEILEEAAGTYRERNLIYGDNYKKLGGILLAMFGGKLPPVRNETDANRLHLFLSVLTKMTRYAENMHKSRGHIDSARDAAVYSAMLEELDSGDSLTMKGVCKMSEHAFEDDKEHCVRCGAGFRRI